MAEKNMTGLGNSKNKKGRDPGVDDGEESSFTKKLMKIRDNLKLGSHHKMERFTIMLGTALTFLLIFAAISFFSHRSGVVETTGAQALFTDEFTFSLSGQNVTVEGVYGDENNTDVMALIKMSDSSSMSANAENYEVFVTGVDDSISYEPDVSFSLFGSTGYGIVRLQHDEPMPAEILDITIRANSSLASNSVATLDEEELDGSFQEFDQGRMYINPGATGVEPIEGLAVGEDDPVKLYTGLVADKLDAEIHDRLEDEIAKIENQINRGQEYTNRLTAAGYKVPPQPWFIEGDYVDEDGVYHIASHLSQAHEYDYQTKTIRDGYLNQVVDDLSKYSAYMQEHDAKVETDEDRPEEVGVITELTDNSGVKLDLETVTPGTNTSAEISVKEDVSLLEGTWSQHLASKATIERSIARELLVLDADVQSQKTTFSTHSGETAAYLY